jgi:serine/threonine-protein kinase HipA
LNPFPDKQRELKTWISEDSGPSGSIRDCLAVARYFGLDKADTTRILKEVTTPVKNWCNLAAKVGMSGTERDKFEPAFEHGELEHALSAT